MKTNFVVDSDLAQRYDPYPAAIDAAPRLRRVNLKLIVGSEDQWVGQDRRFAAHLGHQNLTVDYTELRGIGHDLDDYLSQAGRDLFGFHSTHLRTDG